MEVSGDESDNWCEVSVGVFASVFLSFVLNSPGTWCDLDLLVSDFEFDASQTLSVSLQNVPSGPHWNTSSARKEPFSLKL